MKALPFTLSASLALDLIRAGNDDEKPKERDSKELDEVRVVVAHGLQLKRFHGRLQGQKRSSSLGVGRH